MFFSAKKVGLLVAAKGRLTEAFFPEQGQASPRQELQVHGHHTTPGSHALGHDPEVVAVPSTVKGRSKGRSKFHKSPCLPSELANSCSRDARHGPVLVTGTPVGCQPPPVTPIGGSANGPKMQHLSLQLKSCEAQSLQEASLQLQSLGPEVSLSQEVRACVGHGIAEGNGMSSPRTVSTTQSMGQTPGQEGRESAGQAIMTGLGSVCCHAIRQDMRNYADNAGLKGDYSELTRHFASQRGATAATPAGYGIGSSSDDMQPIHVMDECLKRIQNVGQPE